MPFVRCNRCQQAKCRQPSTRRSPAHTCTTHPDDAHATPCRCVWQWPSHAPQKLQDFEDCDYSVNAAEASIRHGSPVCA